MKKYRAIPVALVIAAACAASLWAAADSRTGGPMALVHGDSSLSALPEGGGGTPEEQAAWREEFAYTLGVQAFIYGFPWMYLPQIRWQWVTQPGDTNWSPYAPFNQFWHARQLSTADYKDGGSPNVDTLYSIRPARRFHDACRLPVLGGYRRRLHG